MIFNFFKKNKKEIPPKLPNLYFDLINIEEIKSVFWLTYEDYVDKSEGKSMYEEDLETIAQWKKDNPDWGVDFETKEVWKLK